MGERKDRIARGSTPKQQAAVRVAVTGRRTPRHHSSMYSDRKRTYRRRNRTLHPKSGGIRHGASLGVQLPTAHASQTNWSTCRRWRRTLRTRGCPRRARSEAARPRARRPVAASAATRFRFSPRTQGMPRAIEGPIHRVTRTGNRFQIRISLSYFGLSGRISEESPDRT